MPSDDNPAVAAQKVRELTERPWPPSKMSSLRLARSAARRATTFSIARRGYAAEVSEKLNLSLALPHKVRETTLGIDMVLKTMA